MDKPKFMLLQSQNLLFSYPASRTFHFPDLQIGQREQWLILGRSGCGKTTLLHLLAGLLTPQGGEVFLNGSSLYRQSESGRDALRGKHIGIVFQRAQLLPALSVWDNLRLAAYLSGKKLKDKQISEILGQLNIAEKLGAKPHTLSEGERQRAAIAKAVIHQPQLILADEPTSGLDDENCAQVWKLLAEVSAFTGASLLVITHDNRLKTQVSNRIELQ